MTSHLASRQEPAADVSAAGAGDVTDDIITAILGSLHRDSAGRGDDQ